MNEKQIKTLELFAGSRSFSKVAEKMGYSTFCIDIKQWGKIDLVKDIEDFSVEDINFTPDILWASPDCTTYSIASCSTHRNRDYTGKTEKSLKADRVLEKLIYTIDVFLNKNPNMLFYIENPRGIMRKMPQMFGMKKQTVWYCQYGDTRAKPTDIFTNDFNWKPRPECKNNNPNCNHIRAKRGSRTGTQGLKNAFDRSKIPEDLFYEIL